MQKRNTEKDKKIPTELFPSELKLIEFIRDIKWGNIEIIVQHERPVLIKKVIQNIKLEE